MVDTETGPLDKEDRIELNELTRLEELKAKNAIVMTLNSRRNSVKISLT